MFRKKTTLKYRKNTIFDAIKKINGIPEKRQKLQN
jgi:hypothetical protein